MGIVYEAEQRSLGKRVALKVLPFAAVLDQKQLQRFKNEAQTAAQLDHPHIVPVFAIGSERGVHFYAMQFVDGQTVAKLISEQRRLNGKHKANQDARLAIAPTSDEKQTTPNEAQSADDTYRGAGGSTKPSSQSSKYFHTVARLGAEAADALQHAHAVGSSTVM
jgi:serine/threonine protein kinase